MMDATLFIFYKNDTQPSKLSAVTENLHTPFGCEHQHFLYNIPFISAVPSLRMLVLRRLHRRHL